ncbi:MAG: COX15/CtaA family protein [Acidimicrobiia bacterium]|nr:COX15/CtaA family protein [Acidimicrobiia bacterium]
MIVVGGLTRLTQSGLSMVRWEPVSGVLPPLSEDSWQAEFDAYKAHPEYRLVNRDMDLSEFKAIFLWEYVHRLLGRIIGLALVVPFVWLLWRRAVPPGCAGRLAGLVLLVGVQGLIGWWMVTSGLVDRPDVAHERLAIHLLAAMLLLVGLLWTALDLRADAAGRWAVEDRPTRWIGPFWTLLVVQLIMGAFVAGLDAGALFTTWPRMAGRWRPPGLTALHPWWSNLVDNPVTVQFVHRWLAVAVAAVAVGAAVVLHRAGARVVAWALGASVLLQFGLGLITLLNAAPVPLAALHQAGAVLLVVVGVFASHWARGGAPPDPGATAWRRCRPDG